MKRISLMWLIAIPFVLKVCFACQYKKSTPIVNAHELPDSTLLLQEAQWFSISYYSNYKVIQVFNPWRKGEVLSQYRVASLPNHDDSVILIPPQRVLLTSSNQIGLLQRLCCLDSIVGLTNARSVYNEFLNKGVESGRIVDLGESMNANLENIILAKPTLIFKSAFENANKRDKLLVQAKIPVVYTAAWMERSPLARLEWIKFYAAFFNQEVKADSIYQAASKSYKQLADQYMNANNKPDVLTGLPYGGVWYSPGGNSFKAKFLSDAGANYFWKFKMLEGSLSLSIEEVIAHQGKSDYWLDVPVSSLSDLLKIDERFATIRALENKQVFNNDNKINCTGMSEFWETSMAYPDRVLNDFVHIIHPQINDDYELYYYRKLK